MTLDKLIEDCVAKIAKHQITDKETDTKICGYGILLPCPYQAQGHTDKEQNFIIPCNYNKPEVYDRL